MMSTQVALALLSALTLAAVVGMWGISDIPTQPDLLPLSKNVTIKDKAEVGGRNLVYTTDNETFSMENVFLYREIAVNGTYSIEYKPISLESVFNVYGIQGHIVALGAEQK